MNFILEATLRIELRIKDLQSSALPLGYVAEKNGAENETRTRDPHLGKVMLYQLSYFRKWRPEGDLNP